MKEVRRCKICQKHFIANRSNMIYCSSKCRETGKRLQIKEWISEDRAKDKAPQKDKKPKEKPLSIAEINARALAEGLSYGKYVAKMGIR